MPHGGLKTSAVVLVATVWALEFHGGVNKEELNQENLAALEAGFEKLDATFTTSPTITVCLVSCVLTISRLIPMRKLLCLN